MQHVLKKETALASVITMVTKFVYQRDVIHLNGN